MNWSGTGFGKGKLQSSLGEKQGKREGGDISPGVSRGLEIDKTWLRAEEKDRSNDEGQTSWGKIHKDESHMRRAAYTRW